MPTPDSIDRPKPTPPAPVRQPGATPWETIFGMGSAPVTIYMNPSTRQVVRVTSPAQVPALIAQGYTPAQVDQSQWSQFVAALGPNFKVLGPQDNPAETPPFQPVQPLSPQELAQVQTATDYANAQSGANQQNLTTGYNISQAGRDRAARVTKENYGATEQSTLTAAALSGAGYDQALGDLFMGRVNRDRSLAGLADEQTSAQFQFDLARQQEEANRRAAVQQIANQALQNNQNRNNSRLDSIFSWILG